MSELDRTCASAILNAGKAHPQGTSPVALDPALYDAAHELAKGGAMDLSTFSKRYIRRTPVWNGRLNKHPLW